MLKHYQLKWQLTLLELFVQAGRCVNAVFYKVLSTRIILNITSTTVYISPHLKMGQKCENENLQDGWHIVENNGWLHQLFFLFYDVFISRFPVQGVQGIHSGPLPPGLIPPKSYTPFKNIPLYEHYFKHILPAYINPFLTNALHLAGAISKDCSQNPKRLLDLFNCFNLQSAYSMVHWVQLKWNIKQDTLAIELVRDGRPFVTVTNLSKVLHKSLKCASKNISKPKRSKSGTDFTRRWKKLMANILL